jgi:hypothetical protein
LRANLARRKDQQRKQSVDARAESGPELANPAPQAEEGCLAPKGSHR